MCSFKFSWIFKRPQLFPRTPTFLPSITDHCTRIWILSCLVFLILLTMSSAKQCCVPNCEVTRGDQIPLHKFPHPTQDKERFMAWIYNIGGNLLVQSHEYTFKNRRVCRKHFELQYHASMNTLFQNAIPTLHMKAVLVSKKRPLSDVTNHNRPSAIAVSPTLSDSPRLNTTGSKTYQKTTKPSTSTSTEQLTGPVSTSELPTLDLKPRPQKKTTVMKSLMSKVLKERDSYAVRLKKAMRLSENKTFKKCLSKFTTLAALFTVMQFRETGKPKMGRRFSKEEKIMALSLYKQGPRAYRWLSKVFILPSPLTLSRLLGKAGIKPGLNKNIFAQLKKRAERMSDNEKLCMLLFDEMSITPHFDYSRRKDLITGFVTNGKEVKRKIADHVLVFMIRGVIHNYKQPISFTFCSGTTPKDELKVLIEDNIKEVQKCGLKVIATVCDQGTTNVSAVNKLIQETRETFIRRNEEHRHDTFIINNEEIVPLFDPPHLIKGIRNNLLTKDLKCMIDGKLKTAKWKHIMQLYEENPAYKGIRLMKNLTEAHVNPKKIPKMKVKFATQIFSKTVATNMGYLAEKGILQAECGETADVLLFFDELFDSMNGSRNSYTQRSAKALLGPVTPKSDHVKTWHNAKRVLKSMHFVTKQGKKGDVPSISNWLRTIDNMELLTNKLHTEFNFKSIWMRHFNQDPLENFFGCIRSHGYRNNSPTPSGFTSAFVSLLVSNISGTHSPGANCEEDSCKMQTMHDLFDDTDKEEIENKLTEIDFEDLDINITDVNEKKQDARIFGSLCYVAGYILRQTKKKIFRNCRKCKECMYSKGTNEYLSKREYFTNKKCLSYPSDHIIAMFSCMQDIVTHVIERRSEINNIKEYCKIIIWSNIDFKFLKCEKHKSKIEAFIIDFTIRFFINTWCRNINKILYGTREERVENDTMKELANTYYKRKNK